MPWEGAEEKKQKQGTNNARLAYVLHVHKPDYAMMKTLLAYAKDMKVWQKQLGKPGVYSGDTYREKPTGKKDSVHPNGLDSRCTDQYN
jgi:hypothetical protein